MNSPLPEILFLVLEDFQCQNCLFFFVLFNTSANEIEGFEELFFILCLLYKHFHPINRN